ncbi:MAG: PLP-dependent aminotransferase family protein [Acidobacteria bacterium]|nr:PLP-dependent aminotransferase family protein [Acidobacteriota bacterium]
MARTPADTTRTSRRAAHRGARPARRATPSPRPTPTNDPLDEVFRGFAPPLRPRYRHLARVLESAIADGRLGSGERLPPERALAARLGLSRTTVVAAYRELEARGLVRAHVGRGTFVCAAVESSGAPFAWRGKVAAAAARSSAPYIRDLLRQATDPRLVSFAAGLPALDGFPEEAFRRAIDRAAAHAVPPVWGHGPTEGVPRLRTALAGRIGLAPEHVLVLSGAQQGLDLIARCLIDPGDVVVMDRPGYLGAIQVFRAAGARLVGWDLAREDLAELEDLVIRHRPKLLYTNPTFQNPTGHTLSLAARRDLLDLAARYRLPLVEDDTYRGLHFAQPPPAPLRELDTQGLVIYVSTFSKVLAPGLRLGWIAATPTIVEQLTLVKQRSDPHTQNLVQEAVAAFLSDGGFDRHLARLRTEHEQRAAAVLEACRRHLPAGHLRLTRPLGGLYLWGQLRLGLRARDVLTRALADGVAFVAGEVFYPDEDGGAGELRLCFTSVARARIDEGIERLARALAASRAQASVPLLPLV